jgi:hypothetical protein
MFFILLLLLVAASGLAARDYHVSPIGDDANPGTRVAPLLTLEKAAAIDLEPGDRILFEGGRTFMGTLRLEASDSGSAGNRVVIGSYGEGRAAINAGDGSAVVLDNANHVSIQRLVLRGSGRKDGNTSSGLVLRRGSHLEIDDIDVSGFRRSGIDIDGTIDARITHVRAHRNGFAGISSGGAVSENLYIGYSLAENNPGDPTVRKNHSGNGIVVGKAKNVLIEYCEARYNGWDMPWNGNGPVGIWTYDSDRVVIQFSVAHHNRSTAEDGGGFDIDGGVTNSIIQYNYSHSNFGAGYLICQYRGAGEFANNVVRYNISQDDGLMNHDAGIYVWVGGEHMKSTLVHNNTIFNSKGSAVAFGGNPQYMNPPPLFQFFNNIFVSQGPQIRGGSKNGVFKGNLYWSVGERGFHVDDYKSLEEWASRTGQEKHEGRLVGRFADPMLCKDGNGLLTDPLKLATLLEYQLMPGSPAIDRGLDLRSFFGVNPGGRDFFGGAVPSGGGFDIGAHESAEKR